MAAKKETSKATKKKTAKTAKTTKKATEEKPAKKKTTKAKAKPKAKAEAKVSKARLYQPHELYEIGETIKHPVWGDEGTIKEIVETPDGLKSIVVDFGDRGTKRLVVDYSLKL